MSCPRCPCPDCEAARSSPLPSPWDRAVPWTLQPPPPAAAQPFEECAIERFMREHPEEKSIMMVCFCSRCRITCG